MQGAGRLTDAQRRALAWLCDRGGDGVWCRGGQVLLCSGEYAPFERKTWARLEEAGLIETYGAKRQGGHGWGRLRTTEKGELVAR